MLPNIQYQYKLKFTVLLVINLDALSFLIRMYDKFDSQLSRKIFIKIWSNFPLSFQESKPGYDYDPSFLNFA